MTVLSATFINIEMCVIPTSHVSLQMDQPGKVEQSRGEAKRRKVVHQVCNCVYCAYSIIIMSLSSDVVI